MKTAILVPNFAEVDGSARVAYLQARDFVKAGQQVAIFALSADMKVPGAELFVLGMPKSLFWQRIYRLIFPLDIIKAWRWVPRLKGYDEVIAHLYPLTWLAYLAREFYKVKYTFWYHGIMDPHFFPKLYERIYIRLQIWLTRLTVQNADRAVAVSKYIQQELKAYTGLESEVIYNQADLSQFRPGLDGTAIRRSYGLANAPLVLFVGALRPVKGVHLLLEAFHLVKQEMPEARLVILGSPDYPYYLDRLRQMADGSVTFVGPQPHDRLPAYYAACDVYASCSRWESYNIPIAEAQACGKPVVAFNLGSHPEVIDSRGVLVETGNVVEFARACVKLLKSRA